MANKFSDKSAERIAECHPDLQRLFNTVLLIADCTILCGYRGERAQTDAYRSGKSQLPWPKSRHNMKPALAIDVAPYPIDFKDTVRFTAFSDVVKMCAKQLGLDVTWGGDWKMKDLVHWELKSEQEKPKK